MEISSIVVLATKLQKYLFFLYCISNWDLQSLWLREKIVKIYVWSWSFFVRGKAVCYNLSFLDNIF